MYSHSRDKTCCEELLRACLRNDTDRNLVCACLSNLLFILYSSLCSLVLFILTFSLSFLSSSLSFLFLSLHLVFSRSSTLYFHSSSFSTIHSSSSSRFPILFYFPIFRLLLSVHTRFIFFIFYFLSLSSSCFPSFSLLFFRFVSSLFLPLVSLIPSVRLFTSHM